MAESAASQNGWRVEAQLEEVALSGGARKALFQVAKEALENCERHARAGRVLVRLEPQGAGARLTIEDDGSGFDPGRIAPDHFGIAGMRERMRELGGDLRVESLPGHGTRVTGTLPAEAVAMGGA
jgi:signal transduction histidine kinase